jgi:hypothetical protein
MLMPAFRGIERLRAGDYLTINRDEVHRLIVLGGVAHACGRLEQRPNDGGKR